MQLQTTCTAYHRLQEHASDKENKQNSLETTEHTYENMDTTHNMIEANQTTSNKG